MSPRLSVGVIEVFIAAHLLHFVQFLDFCQHGATYFLIVVETIFKFSPCMRQAVVEGHFSINFF